MDIAVTINPLWGTETVHAVLEAGVQITRLPFWAMDSADVTRSLITQIRSHRSYPRVILDLPGNKIRIGRLASSTLRLAASETYFLTSDAIASRPDHIPVPSSNFVRGLQPGDILCCGDADALLEVMETGSESVRVRSLRVGTIASYKGIGTYGHEASVSSGVDEPFASAAITFAVDSGADGVAISFVKNPAEISRARGLVDQPIQIIAKIETADGAENARGIIEAADGVVIGRGDLLNYAPLSRIPEIQKTIVAQCISQSCYVIVSTGILISLLDRAMPRAAELQDIAHIVSSGADCIQLCEETAHANDPGAVIQILKDVLAGL